MGFSKKGKRKIIYNEEIFYWFIKRDEDYGTDHLNIIKEDRSLVIFYRVNQISDEFIHPKVFIEKSFFIFQLLCLYKTMRKFFPSKIRLN